MGMGSENCRYAKARGLQQVMPADPYKAAAHETHAAERAERVIQMVAGKIAEA